MQTIFTAEQLRDPDTAVANQVLRTCVHCGFCTATCPTFVLLGDELDSPRGRIYLIKDMLEAGRPATEEVVRHVDRCLSCLSCMTTCPSGVTLHASGRSRPDPHRADLPPALARPAAAGAAGLGAAASRAVPRSRWPRRALARPFAGLLPRAQSAGRAPAAPCWRMAPLAPAAAQRARRGRGSIAPWGRRRFRVALLAGCAQRVLDPAINDATIRLLTRLGGEVVVPAGAGCCGALTHHMGRHDPGHGARRAPTSPPGAGRSTARGWTASSSTPSGCGTTVKDYGFMLRGEPEADGGGAGGLAGPGHHRGAGEVRLRAVAAARRG